MLSRGNAVVLLNTIGLSLVKTCLATGLALFLSWIVARTDTPYRETLEGLITLPFYIPPILTAMAWGMLATYRFTVDAPPDQPLPADTRVWLSVDAGRTWAVRE
jgi:ABC-type Fe3+ transport system permease subunit